jgi:hypothetical protein
VWEGGRIMYDNVVGEDDADEDDVGEEDDNVAQWCRG